MVQFLFALNDWGLVILRVVVGVIMIKHGLPKLRHLGETSESFSKMGFKPGKFWAIVAGVVEFVGGLLLIAGFLTQIVSVLIALQFLVILVKLNWFAREKFGEWEYDLLIFASTVLLATSGAGAYSVDEWLGLILY